MVRLKGVREKHFKEEKYLFVCGCGFKAPFNIVVNHLVKKHNIPRGVAESELYHIYFSRNGRKDNK
jgi:hypothetical protein